MTTVMTGASMSLDGYIAGPGETGFELLFAWHNNGDVLVPTVNPELSFQLTDASAAYQRSLMAELGSLLVGRKLWDFTKAWGGQHPLGVHTVVLTHNVPDGWPVEGEHFTFVTDGIESAVEKAKSLAGDKSVGVNGGSMASQCLNAGLLDEIGVDLVPVLLGGGTPFFDQLVGSPVELEGPISAVDSVGVTHLRYRVKK